MAREISRGAFRAEVLERNPRGPNAVVASAVNVTMTGGRIKRPTRGKGWQQECWRFFNVITEYHQGITWVGNMLSKARLLVYEDGVPSQNLAVQQILEDFFGGSDQHGEYLRQAGIHMSVPGEYYVVGYEDEDGDDVWRVVAATRISYDGSGWKIFNEDAITTPLLVMRVWRPHPEDNRLSDSPSRAAIPVLSQIEQLSMHVSAQADSRLTSAGFLLVPSEVSFSGVPGANEADPTVADSLEGADALVKMMMDVMALAKANPASASAKIPIVIQAAAEYLKEVRFMDMWTQLDTHAETLRSESLRRLANGLDMPPEVLQGTADSNHWSAWAADEASIKVHTEPLLAVICAALTQGYLRPQLMAELNMEKDATKSFIVVADTALMRVRPDKSKAAIELHDRMIVSDETTRRENGFMESDKPSDEEFAIMVLRGLLKGTPTPDQIAAAITALVPTLQIPSGVAVRETIRDDLNSPLDPVQASKPQPQLDSVPQRRALDGHPNQGPPAVPQTAPATTAAMLAAAEIITFRALERAGNKMKTRLNLRLEGVAACDLYQKANLTTPDIDAVLDGAWDNVARFTANLGVPSAELVAALDGYVRMLFATHSEHDPVVMRNHLAMTIRKMED